VRCRWVVLSVKLKRAGRLAGSLYRLR